LLFSFCFELFRASGFGLGFGLDAGLLIAMNDFKAI
jgi:hypothetical protein